MADYEVNFTVVVSAADDAESAVEQARVMIADDDFEPVSVEKL